MDGGTGEVAKHVPKEVSRNVPLKKGDARGALERADEENGGAPILEEHRYVRLQSPDPDESLLFVVEQSRDSMPPHLQDAVQHKNLVDLVTATGMGGVDSSQIAQFSGGYLRSDGEDLVYAGISTSIPPDHEEQFVHATSDEAKANIYLIDPGELQQKLNARSS